MDLAELFNFYGSDKDINGYTQLYHALFYRMKNENVKLLEIGIGTLIPEVHSSMLGFCQAGYKPGGSLRAWRDFFVNGKIIGLDIQPDTQFSDEDRIETYLCNSTKKFEIEPLMKSLTNDNSDLFDIIIDDGSHVDNDQWVTLQYMLPYLKEGGYYIIEDIPPGSRVSEIPNLTEALAQGYPIFFSGLKNNLCIIHKIKLNSQRRNY